MIIQTKAMIQQAKTVEDLKPILMLLEDALNTMSDAKKQVRGDSVYHDGGIVLRSNDNNYWRMTLIMSGTTPIAHFTYVGLNPTGE